MTDNEIIKALNYCCGNIKNNDEGCNKDMCYQVTLPESRDEGIRFCRQWLIKDALDLINRQKAEIERLNIELQSMRSAANSYKMHYETAKSEAIEEFAERLKGRLTGIGRSTIYGNFEYGTIKSYEIDNLVKEMTEESKGVRL